MHVSRVVNIFSSKLVNYSTREIGWVIRIVQHNSNTTWIIDDSLLAVLYFFVNKEWRGFFAALNSLRSLWKLFGAAARLRAFGRDARVTDYNGNVKVTYVDRLSLTLWILNIDVGNTHPRKPQLVVDTLALWKSAGDEFTFYKKCVWGNHQRNLHPW